MMFRLTNIRTQCGLLLILLGSCQAAFRSRSPRGTSNPFDSPGVSVHSPATDRQLNKVIYTMVEVYQSYGLTGAAGKAREAESYKTRTCIASGCGRKLDYGVFCCGCCKYFKLYEKDYNNKETGDFYRNHINEKMSGAPARHNYQCNKKNKSEPKTTPLPKTRESVKVARRTSLPKPQARVDHDETPRRSRPSQEQPHTGSPVSRFPDYMKCVREGCPHKKHDNDGEASHQFSGYCCFPCKRYDDNVKSWNSMKPNGKKYQYFENFNTTKLYFEPKKDAHCSWTSDYFPVGKTKTYNFCTSIKPENSKYQ